MKAAILISCLVTMTTGTIRKKYDSYLKDGKSRSLTRTMTHRQIKKNSVQMTCKPCPAGRKCQRSGRLAGGGYGIFQTVSSDVDFIH